MFSFCSYITASAILAPNLKAYSKFFGEERNYAIEQFVSLNINVV